jgi:hypothetical protein
MQFCKKDNKLEREKIFNAFPATLRQDVEKVIEILPLSDHNVLLVDGQIHKVDDLIHSNEQLLYLDKEELKIPYRLYFNEPSLDKEKFLTELQKTILNCIFLRHHNGYIRQRRLERLVDKTEYFVIPFVFQLLGEYVMEILEVLEKHINTATIDNYTKFITENPKYWIQTESRMISYWNEYYRRPMYPSYLPPKYATRKEYIGQQIVDRLKKRTHNIGIANSGA